MDVYKLILFLSNVPIFTAGIIALLYYKHFGKALKVFSWFVFVSGIIQLTSVLLWMGGVNNLPLLHLYTPVGTALLLLFYQTVLKGYLPHQLLTWVAGVFVIVCIVNSVFFQGIFTFNSNALTLQSMLIIILSLSTYVLSVNDTFKVKRQNLLSSMNWVNSGLFIYFSSSLILFYFGDLLIQRTPKQFRVSWVLHSLFIVVMYILVIKGLWIHRKKQSL